MRSASLPAVALVLTLSALGGACATSTEIPDTDSGITPAKDAGKDVKSGTDSAGPVCIGTCGTDQECQNSCPSVVNSGVNCCDQGTNKCFPVADSVCPAPVDPDAGQPPAY